jgi:hypothetical protein
MVAAGQAVNADPAFSFTKLLKPHLFYTSDRNKMAARYSVAFSVVEFLLAGDKDDIKQWRSLVDQVIAQGEGARFGPEAALIDQRYRDYMKRWAGHGAQPDSESEARYVAARHRCDVCMGEPFFVGARLAALRMYYEHPDSPTALVYLGDVFWETRIPLVALEYYVAAATLEERGHADEVPGRVQSRLADAYESLGRIDEATEIWRAVPPSSPSSVAMAIVQYRNLFKADYYEAIRGGPLWGNEESTQILNEYLRSLVGDIQAAEGPRDARAAYERTRDRMKVEMANTSISVAP